MLSAATFCLLAFAGARVSAQSCNTDTDCPQSYACVASGTSTSPACKGTGCPADAAASEPVVYKSCQPKACAIDADCGTGMVCFEHKVTSCAGSGFACAANTKCDAGPVMTTETCTTTSEKLCAFKWQVPCNADSDCGDRFVCQPSVSGGCGTSGHAVSAGPNGVTTSPPAADAGAPDCPTTTSFPGSCTPKATTCTADTECPSGWTCTALGTPEPVTGAGSPTSVAVDVAATSPADSVDADRAQTKLCIGPLGAGEPTRGGVDVATHQGSDAATSPTSAGGGATGGTTGGANASSGSSSGGCSIAPVRAGDSALMLLGFTTVALAVVRRRRK
ncbi:MAG: hypothetical protein ACJ8F1_17665 [Polyangia bacterium]